MIELKQDTFKLRLVQESDAAFIIGLRTDPLLSRYINPTSIDVEAQQQWINAYKQREAAGEEYYFVAENFEGEKLGLTRLYHFRENKFELGSWIFKKGLPESIPVIADMATRDFAFDVLGFDICTFEVNKKNASVVKYHKLFKPQIVREDEQNYYFELPAETYRQQKQKILKLFSNGA